MIKIVMPMPSNIFLMDSFSDSIFPCNTTHASQYTLLATIIFQTNVLLTAQYSVPNILVRLIAAPKKNYVQINSTTQKPPNAILYFIPP